MNLRRWGIALAGIILQVVLGSVYAWSVFRVPLSKQYHWTISEVTLTFTLSIMVLGFAAFFGGLWLNKSGPRLVAVTGALLYGAGTALASFSGDRLWWLYLSYGVIGGIVSIGNAVGRVFWAWVSDLLSRRATFAIMFVATALLFWLLPGIASSSILTLVAFLILMVYGGGFGTMPAFAADYFGSKNVGPIYGLMLTAWGFASAFGPLLVANMRQASGSYRSGFHTLAAIVFVATLIPLLMRPPVRKV